VYGLIRAMPGTPVTGDIAQMDPSKQLTPEAIERLNRLYGLDKPWYSAYFVWTKNLLRFDLGVSFTRNMRPVGQLIVERAPATLMLSASSLVLTYLLSIPIGLWSTAKAGTLPERGLSTALYMLYSLPAFVAALYLQLLFYVKLDWLPLFGMQSDDYETFSTAGKALDVLKHAAMPIICFTYGSLAYYSRFIRANMQEVVRQDYIRTARAKGVGPRTILWKHAFRNTLIPLVTLLGLTLPSLFSGAVILEQIFQWPGMGRLYFEAIGQRDYNVVMGLTLMFSVLTLLGQLLADVLYAVVDPRVSYS
jgi:peptide/nickel transport system permease protein